MKSPFPQYRPWLTVAAMEKESKFNHRPEIDRVNKRKLRSDLSMNQQHFCNFSFFAN